MALKTALYWVVALGSISIHCWLVVAHRLPLFPTLLIFPPILVGAIWWVVRSVSRHPARLSTEAFPFSKLAWIGIGMYTGGFIVQLINWIRQPSMETTIQLVAGMFAPACLGIIVYRMHRFSKRQGEKRQ